MEAKHIAMLLTCVGGLVLAFYLVYTNSVNASENLTNSQNTNDKFIATVREITDTHNQVVRQVTKEFTEALDRNTKVLENVERAMYRNPNIAR